MENISPFLWFNDQAETAANFYISIFKNSKITNISYNTEATPGPTGGVMVVAFELNGQPFLALNGGPQFPFTEAVSFVINCEDQQELDYFWNSLTAEGGKEVECGWLKDKFGLCWQVVPKNLNKLLQSKEAGKSARVMNALMKMKKLDIATLENA